MPEHARPDQDSDARDCHEEREAGARPETGRDFANPDGNSLFGRFEKTGPSWTNMLGESWPAHDIETGSDVVITRLPRDLTDSEWVLNQLDAEVEILRHLRDEAIVGVLEFIRDEQGAFLVEEAFEGEDLATFLARDEGTNADEAEVLALGILHTLEVAHATGIPHRDLRPEHVFINAEGFIKVRGFSVARILRDQQTALQREIKNKAQMLAYSPPEDLLNMGTDTRGDIYSFGCLVYHLYTGQPPFTDGNVAYSHVHHAPVPPAELCPSMPDVMNEVVLYCLAKKPDDRFDTAGDVRVMLDGESESVEECGRTGFRPLIPLAAAAVLVIAAAGAVYFLKGKQGSATSGTEPGSSEMVHASSPDPRTGARPTGRQNPDLASSAAVDAGGKAGNVRPEGFSLPESGNRLTSAAGAQVADPRPSGGAVPGSAAPQGEGRKTEPAGSVVRGESDTLPPDSPVPAADGERTGPEAGHSDRPEPPVARPEPTGSASNRESGPPDSPEPIPTATAQPAAKLDATAQCYSEKIAEAEDLGQQGRFDQAVAAYVAAREILPDRTESTAGLSRIYCAWGNALARDGRFLEAQQAYRRGLRHGEDSRDRLLEVRDRIHTRMNKGFSVIQEPPGPRVACADITLTVSIDQHPLKQMNVNEKKIEAADDGTCCLHLTGLADGHHAFKIEAMDAGGNMVIREIAVEVDTRYPRICTFSPKSGEELPASRVVIHGEVDESVAEVQSEPKATDLVIKDRSFVATVPVEGLFPVVRFKVVDQVGHASPEQQIKLYNPTWIPPGLEPRGDKVYSLKDQSYMVRVPGVRFIVRDDRGRPRHCKVHPFFADVTEVTNAQYRRFLEWVRNASNPRQFSHASEPVNKDHTPAFWDGSDRAPDDVPVVGVDWWDAYAYAGWAGKSLFHDVTWVVTARGVPESLYPWGDALPRRTYANYLGDPAGGPVPVLKYEQGRSPFGCYEMAGNVMEWCLDENPDSDRRRAQGGSWFHSPRFLRTGHGVYYPPSLRTKFLGFRCARYLTDEPEQKTDTTE